MATDAKSDWLENAVIDHFLGTSSHAAPAAVYVALFTADPGEGTGGTEVTGGSYARQAATFSAASGGSTSNTADLVYSNMPAVTITHFGIFHASTAGNLLYYVAFTTSKTTNTGDTATIASGTLTVSEL